MSANIREALDKASGKKTPQNPSRTAIARVSNPLSVPCQCRYCAGKVDLVSNSAIYGREFGEWPWAYLCADCGAYVGLHPFTAIPLGTLADAPTRVARKAAKAAFNPIWQDAGSKERKRARTAAYVWLAGAMGISDVGACHIGWFDVAQCRRVVDVCVAAGVSP